MDELIKVTIINARILVEYSDHITGEEEQILKRFIESYEDSNNFELIDDLIKKRIQPLYDKITTLETTVSALARIATEYSENYPGDYQKLSDFLNRKG